MGEDLGGSCVTNQKLTLPRSLGMNDHNLRLSRRHDSGAFSQNKGSVSINGSNVNILLLNNLVQNTSVSGRWGGDFSKLEMLNDTIFRPEDVIDSDVHSL